MSDDYVPEPVPVTPQIPKPPTTTLQEDLMHAGQRRINLIWEYTQAAVALVVVTATMGAGLMEVFGKSMGELPTIMSVAFGTVVGFYFGRTNHTAQGGIGYKNPYEGR